MGPITHLGETEKLWREIERLQSHLGETEIPIGKTDLLRVCGSGYDFGIGGAGLEESVWPILALGHLWMWESSWGFLEHITKHMKQEAH